MVLVAKFKLFISSVFVGQVDQLMIDLLIFTLLFHAIYGAARQVFFSRMDIFQKVESRCYCLLV